MEEFATLIALVLAGIIVTHESLRVGKCTQIDFLMGASLLYLICYSIVPIFVQTLKDRDLGFWNWIFRLSFNRREYLSASLLSVAGYLAIIAGFYATKYGPVGKTLRDRSANTAWFIPETLKVTIAFFFGLVGIVSLFIYANEVGGFAIMVQSVGFFRNQTEAYSDFGFLIKVAPFASVSSYVFWDVFTSSTGNLRKGLYGIGFWLMFMASLLILYSLGGRVQFGFYLLVFVIYVSFRRRRLPKAYAIIGGICFVAIVLFGKEVISQNVYVSDDLIGSAWEELSTDPLSGIRKILLEFSFPFITLGNILDLVPNELGYRWFVDVPLGFAYLLPKPLLGLTLPPTVTMAYDDYMDVPIPIDLLSFGYTSMGAAGMILVCLAYGFVLCVADCYFPAHGNKTLVLLRAAWLLYLSAQVMYGSPQHALVAGFPLLVGTLVIVLCGRCKMLSNTTGKQVLDGNRYVPA
ncbi:MAG: hypothetical protein C5B60_04230 [Chloroflexi bacterium]|nr:MAG: hypothetical protein C5B60_04230 [Chloroflexota bacterium]